MSRYTRVDNGARSPLASPTFRSNHTNTNHLYAAAPGGENSGSASANSSTGSLNAALSPSSYQQHPQLLPATSPRIMNDANGNSSGTNPYRSAGMSNRTTTTGNDSSVGGHEYGPYAPLNRQAYSNQTPSASLDGDSASSSARDKALKSGGLMGSGLGYAGYTPDVEDGKKRDPDDYLHDPSGADKHSNAVSLRGLLNILTLVILVLGLLTLFAGYPVIYHFLSQREDNKGGYGLGGTNGTGQVAKLIGLRSLVDPDTPASARTFSSTVSGKTYQLQFSDEFEQEGRTFWSGDDPYWEAVNIWYGATGDYEWYSPENVNTTGGALQITMTDIPSHNLNFQSGMLQSWNKLCFTGGYIEFSIIQPGSHSTSGYWPGAWLMGNLGRPGYLGTTDGMWPYSYQGCDTGILANQTNAQGGPVQAVDSTAQYAANGQLSKLPGMKTPSCTCSGEDHPGPNNKVGRSAPELDILEAQIQSKGGVKNSYASQSLQTAPYDDQYFWVNTSAAVTIEGANTDINSYVGGPYQEAVSAVSLIPQRGFQHYDAPDSEKWVTYAVEYEPDYAFNGGGSVTWYVDGKATWTVTGAALPASEVMEISRRIIPVEPMSIIMNLGMSKGFQTVDFDPDTGVTFPATMKFDYVRVYQEKGKEQMSCDPDDYPTADYIKNHIDVYNNPNITQWKFSKYKWPGNKLNGGC